MTDQIVTETDQTSLDNDAPDQSVDDQNGSGSALSQFTSPEEVDAAAQVIWEFLGSQGRATKDEIRNWCKAAGIRTPLYQKALTRLDRQLNIITEVTEESTGEKAWMMKEQGRGIDLQRIIQIANEVRGETKKREEYKDWYEMRGIFTFTAPCLASSPDPREASKRNFLRGDVEGNFLLFHAGYYTAMLRDTLATGLAPSIGSARYKIRWRQQLVPVTSMGTVLRPVPPSRPGASGQGVTTVECLPVGTRLPFAAVIPGSHVSPEDFMRILDVAGDFVGISPSAAHKGFGRFVATIENAQPE